MPNLKLYLIDWIYRSRIQAKPGKYYPTADMITSLQAKCASIAVDPNWQISESSRQHLANHLPRLRYLASSVMQLPSVK